MTKPAKGSWFRQPVKKSLLHSYRFGVVLCELTVLGYLLYQGGPFWPPYLLMLSLAFGAIVGLLGVRRLRLVMGLPVIPRREAVRRDKDAKEP